MKKRLAIPALLLLLLLSPAAYGQEEAASPAPPADKAEKAPGTPAAGTPAAGSPAAGSPAAKKADIVPEEAFVNANAAYEAGDHEKAIELYEALLEDGYENGHLYYNLGNAYLRGGELGRAIASYRRSQVFLPRDQDVRANLDFARKSAKDAIVPPGPGPVLSTLFFWHYSLSPAELGTLLVVLNVLFWALLVVRIYRRDSEVLRWAVIVLLLLVLTVGGSFALRQLMPEETAVIVPQEVEVRSGTSVHDVVLFKLHAGTEVRVVDHLGESVRIALPEEEEEVRGGWIAAADAEIVRR